MRRVRLSALSMSMAVCVAAAALTAAPAAVPSPATAESPAAAVTGDPLTSTTVEPESLKTKPTDQPTTKAAIMDKPGADVSAAAPEDAYRWLEAVEAPESLTWVRGQNATTEVRLLRDPDYAPLQRDLLAILDSDARIPMVAKRGPWLFNFWRDKAHPQGIWRRTTLDEYRKAAPDWQVLLDLDALSKADGVTWVWAGVDCLRPDYNRCLVELSRGGADATITREFDIGTGIFIADGFSRSEAKGALGWKDIDTVYVDTDFGPGSMTTSGYPRIVKQWRRGTPLATANVVYEGQPDDLGVAAYHDGTPAFERDFVSRSIAYYNGELYLRRSDGRLLKVDAPNSAKKWVHREWLLLQLREPWDVGGVSYVAGALIATHFDRFMDGEQKFQMLFEPAANSSLAAISPTLNHLLINVLEDVKNRLYVLSFRDGAWQREALRGAPRMGSVSVAALDADESDDYLLTVTDYLTPTTLSLGGVDRDPEPLKQLPAFFDAEGLEVTQHFVSSDDGTRVPYFMVARKGLTLDGSHPTLLYGYGGFEISETPYYAASIGRAWLSAGGVFAVANIRGGGEYGPRWHQAALKQNRLRAYEDFAAVARDLIGRKVTSPKRLGIQGGSNGGLLVGNMLVHYPALFGAVVCQVPLLDMRRYHTLLAGASWMAEYGDPDDAAQWAFMQGFSPYHLVRGDAKYPPVLFLTSTRDDRVHPAHARKMMAKMQAQGHDVLYYENIEGGHGGSANNAQSAKMSALAFTFLRERLFAPD